MAHFKFSQHLIQNFWEIQCHFQKVYNQTEKPHTPKCRLTMFNDLRLKALHKWDQTSEKGGDHAFEIRKRQRLVMLLKVSLRTIHHQGVHGTSNTSNLTFFFFFFLFFSFVFFFSFFYLRFVQSILRFYAHNPGVISWLSMCNLNMVYLDIKTQATCTTWLLG